MSQPYGAAVSGKQAESGQKHRSGPNFQFLAGLPSEGDIVATITGTPNPGSIDATLYKDVSLGFDKKIGSFKTGGIIDVKDVNSSDSYYLADPSGATEDFVVYFTA